MNRENEVWNGVFSRIKQAMGSRTASDAVLYILTRDKIPYVLPINLVGAKDLAADLSSRDKIKYIGFVLVSHRIKGEPGCEFHPIYPAVAWPQDIVQVIIERALEALGQREVKSEDGSPRRMIQNSYPYTSSKPSHTQTPLSL
jgi:hypothetical protein